MSKNLKDKKIEIEYEKAGKRKLGEILKIVESIEKKVKKAQVSINLHNSDPINNEFVL